MSNKTIKSFDLSRTGPLDGIRVLDLSRLVAGNMLSVVLGDFGADVIKVENPGRGDDLRHWRVGGIETWWKVYGRNKRSLELNLKDAKALSRLKALVKTSDVFIENFVPGKLEALGLSPEILLDLNPKLIIVRVTAWGQTGPYANKPGFGTLVEAMSGYAHINGFPDKPPALPPLATADMVAGLYGAFAVLVAVREVEQNDGTGQIIDLSLFESMFSLVASEAVKHRVTGEVSFRSGNQSVNTAPRNIYMSADGKYVALSGSMQSMFERLVRTIGRPDLIEDPMFATNDDRIHNRDALDKILQDYFGTRTIANILEIMDEAGVTVAPVLSVADLMDHPFVVDRGVLEELADEDLGACPLNAPVPRLSSTPGGFRRPAPRLGEHTGEILQSLEKGEG
ncbi:succinyl-CoA--L-malate CoA-transferase beta subunit [bacterium MnTg02]|nr:succinyl-CoA--L-malate CoA-transferase beta subunit [bacterium MnTg02]